MHVAVCFGETRAAIEDAFWSASDKPTSRAGLFKVAALRQGSTFSRPFLIRHKTNIEGLKHLVASCRIFAGGVFPNLSLYSVPLPILLQLLSIHGTGKKPYSHQKRLIMPPRPTVRRDRDNVDYSAIGKQGR